MRNCQRRRPCCGDHHGKDHHHGGGCGEVEVIVEPTVHCQVPERHHHQRVRHIVPIVYHQAHHHHKHHEYEVKRKHTHKHHHHEHGRFEGDWCDVDGRGGKGSRCEETSAGSEFQGEFDSGCGSEMYM